MLDMPKDIYYFANELMHFSSGFLGATLAGHIAKYIVSKFSLTPADEPRAMHRHRGHC
jgi:hypothetical protein